MMIRETPSTNVSMVESLQVAKELKNLKMFPIPNADAEVNCMPCTSCQFGRVAKNSMVPKYQ